jgi:hypothetical protein
VLRLERTILRRNPATRLWTRSCETVFRVSSASEFSPEQWNAWIRGHWRIENGSLYVRDATFAEDASRIRKNPDMPRGCAPSLTICFAPARTKTSKTPDGAQGSTSTSLSKQRR